MRILIATDAWHPQINGVVTTTQAMVQHAIKLGHEVLVIEPSMFPGIACPWYKEVKVVLPINIEKQINKFKPDCIHLVTESTIGLAVRNYCVKRKYKFTTSFHTNFAEYGYEYFYIPMDWTWKYLKWFHRDSSLIFVPNKIIGEKLKDQGFISPVALMNRGVDHNIFKTGSRANKQYSVNMDMPIPKEKQKTRLLYVGRISQEKNLEEFCKLSYIEENNFEMVVVGRGPILVDLKQKYPDVHFVGVLANLNLARMYQTSDVLIFPSLTDTFGIVMIESMACGTPVLAHKEPGPLSLIKSGENGYFYDTFEELKTLIPLTVQLDRDKVHKSVEDYSWEEVTKLWLKNLRKK